MGYAFYKQVWNGEERDAGYSVEAECDYPGCHTIIDRGMAYMCGNNPHAPDYGCGGFFCEEHRICDRCITCLEDINEDGADAAKDEDNGVINAH